MVLILEDIYMIYEYDEVRLFNRHVDYLHIDSVKSFLEKGYYEGIYTNVLAQIQLEASFENKTIFEKIVHPLLNRLPFTKVVNRQPYTEMLSLIEKYKISVIPVRSKYE